MKEVILSHDGELMLYLVPDEVAEHLDQYCWDFAANWVWYGPEHDRFCREFGDGLVGVMFGAPDFIDYLNRYLFAEQQSKLVKGLGCYELPEEYREYPHYNF